MLRGPAVDALVEDRCIGLRPRRPTTEMKRDPAKPAEVRTAGRLRDLPGVRAVALVACSILALYLGSCRTERAAPGAPAATAAGAPRWNVVLVLVDTLRADHVGTYGYGRATTPNLDRFAADGVVFEAARSQAACTFPSVNSLLTSRWPAGFLGRSARSPEGDRAPDLSIPPDLPSLPRTLADAGWFTAAVSASPIVRRGPTRFNRFGGFQHGFGQFDEACLWREARCVVEAARAALRSRPTDRPFFLYVHFMDVHGPYRAPRAHFSRPYRGTEDYVGRGDPNPIARRIAAGIDPGVMPSDVDHLVDLYDDEIRYFDEEFGRLLESLRSEGLLDSTVFVLTADHGEEFLEHGGVKHCSGVYDTAIRVPLVLRWPDGPRGVRVPGAVALLDVVPTVIDLLGLAPLAGAEGVSLRNPASLDPGRAVFSMQGPWRAVTTGDRKLILDLRDHDARLYDLASDPVESRDRAVREASTARDLQSRWTEWARGRSAESADDAVRHAEETERQLKAIGYLE